MAGYHASIFYASRLRHCFRVYSTPRKQVTCNASALVNGMAAVQRYFSGPVFDVQAHAILPASFPSVLDTLQPKSSPTNDTTAHNFLEICVNLADNLVGKARNETLGESNKQVVTVNAFFPNLPADQLLEFVNETNSWMATAVSGRNNLVGTAIIPPSPRFKGAGLAPDGITYRAKGVDLVRHAIQNFGLKGIMMSSSYENAYLGDASIDPYFALAHELQVPIIIHPPVVPIGASAMPTQGISQYAGYLNDQRAGLLSMVMSGTLDRYPNLKIVATHLGGGILTGLGRFQQLDSRFPRNDQYLDPRDNSSRMLREPIDSYLKRLYYDCNNAEGVDIHHALSVVGSDHLLTGTDFPWTNDTFTRQILGELDITTANKIAFLNALAIFG